MHALTLKYLPIGPFAGLGHVTQFAKKSAHDKII
jgi:hypothetical protein